MKGFGLQGKIRNRKVLYIRGHQKKKEVREKERILEKKEENKKGRKEKTKTVYILKEGLKEVPRSHRRYRRHRRRNMAI
jgi:hypothetical protein